MPSTTATLWMIRTSRFLKVIQKIINIRYKTLEPRHLKVRRETNLSQVSKENYQEGHLRNKETWAYLITKASKELLSVRWRWRMPSLFCMLTSLLYPFELHGCYRANNSNCSSHFHFQNNQQEKIMLLSRILFSWCCHSPVAVLAL